MKKSVKTNLELAELIRSLKKLSWEKDAPIWRDIAKRLEKPASSWSEINLSRISRNTKKNDVVVVPGKVLATGTLNFPITIAAFNFSEQAQQKIAGSGSKNLTIKELAKKYPKGTGIKIVG